MASGPKGYEWDASKRKWVKIPVRRPDPMQAPRVVTGKPKPGPARPSPDAQDRNDQAAAARNTPKVQLEILRKAGYNLPKGWGPVALRAWKNYQAAKARGLDVRKAGAYWSAHQKSATASPSGPGGGGGGAGSGGAGGGSGGVVIPEENPLGAIGDEFSQLLLDSMKSLINPSKFAVQAANAEYDGTLGALARQIKQNPIDRGQHIRDLANWYGQADRTRERGQQANIQLAKQAEGSLNDSIGAVSGALGPEVGGMVGAWGQTLAAGLQGDANAQKGFDNSFEGIFAQEAAAAKQNESNYMAKLMQELQGQRTGLIREKGQKRAQYLAEGQGQRFQQLAALQNMILGANEMGVDMELKNAQLTGVKNQNLLDELKIDYARDQLAEGGQEDPSQLPLDARMKLIQALKGSVISRGKSGVPQAKPQTLYSRFAAEMGLDTTNPGHRKFLLQVLRSLYPNATKYPFKFAK